MTHHFTFEIKEKNILPEIKEVEKMQWFLHILINTMYFEDPPTAMILLC